MNFKKPNHFITEAEALRIINAVGNTFRIGAPLTEYIVIHWERAGVKSRVQESNIAFLKRAGEWLRRRSVPVAYVWTLENPMVSERSFGGLHINIMIHVPELLRGDFQHHCRTWIALVGGVPKRGVFWRGPVPNEWTADSYDYLRRGVVRLLRYVLKGLEPKLHDAFYIEPRHRLPQGVIFGKRCGCSESISPRRYGPKKDARVKRLFEIAMWQEHFFDGDPSVPPIERT